jgi:hypothetical protein
MLTIQKCLVKRSHIDSHYYFLKVIAVKIIMQHLKFVLENLLYRFDKKKVPDSHSLTRQIIREALAVV